MNNSIGQFNLYPLISENYGIDDLLIPPQSNNDHFEFNNISYSHLLSNLNNSASRSDFLSKNSNMYKNKSLKTTRSGLAYDAPKADAIIDNPGLYGEASADIFSTQKIFQSLKTPFGKSRYEKSTWIKDIETAGLFGKMDERTTRSGKAYGSFKNQSESLQEETDFDEYTKAFLEKGMNDCLIKRPSNKMDINPTASVISTNKKIAFVLKRNTTCLVSYQDPKQEDAGNEIYDDYPNYNSTIGHPNYDLRCPDYNPGNYDPGNYDNNSSVGEFLVNNLTPGHDFMNPNEFIYDFSKSPKKIKLSPKIKTETTKKNSKKTSEESKTFRCRMGSCQLDFVRSDLLKRHQKTHSTIKLFKCTECPYTCNRKDNLDNHMRIHFNAKPYICPYAMYKKDENTWEPCRYAAARQDDLTKHCIGTAVCHLEKFSPADKKNHEKSGFPVPAKIMNSSKRTSNFKLRKGHVKLSEPLYREYVNQSEDFMYVVELKIMKKWTAIWNAAVKKKDENTKKMLRRKCIPNLMQGKNYDHMRHHVFDNPQFEFCDVILNLNSLDRRCLFEYYELGSKVEDKHVNPRIQAWSNEETHYWKNKVDFEIKHRLENNC